MGTVHCTQGPVDCVSGGREMGVCQDIRLKERVRGGPMLQETLLATYLKKFYMKNKWAIDGNLIVMHRSFLGNQILFCNMYNPVSGLQTWI